jgi:hypothetical protein
MEIALLGPRLIVGLACSLPERKRRLLSAYSSTARLRARDTTWTSTRTETACSETAAYTGSRASTTRSASGRWRSRSSSQARRRTCSLSGSRRWRHS